MGAKLENILVIKLRYIGDVLLTTPLLRNLRTNYPHARITVLVNSGTENILQNNPCVDQVRVLPRGNVFQQLQFFRSLRKCRYDCVIDLSDGDRSAIITALSGSPMKIGFNHEGRWRGKVYSWSLYGQYGTMHMLDYHAQTLIPLGIEPRVCALELNVRNKESQAAEEMLASYGLRDKKWVMLHPAARYWFKAWPPERFAVLGDALIGEGYQVILIGSENERGIADEVMQGAEQKFISLVGKTNLRDLPALMKRCSLFVGNDAGPMHMAAAVDCPVISLFGPTDPAVWGPPGKFCHTIYKGLDCRECFHPGCFRGDDSCMKLITVDEVFQAAKRALAGEE